MKVLGSYINGNYRVVILNDGTKIRTNDLDNLTPNKPEAMDLKITNKCDIGCAFCVLPTAKLYREDSSFILIKDVRIGETVMAFDENKNELVSKKVAKRYERPYEGELIVITTGDGHIIKCTPNHKIFTKNRGYVEAINLNTNDELLSI